MGRKSSGVAKGGLITGIIGTSLAGALAMGLGDNCGNGGLLGNLFGGRQCGPTAAEAMQSVYDQTRMAEGLEAKTELAVVEKFLTPMSQRLCALEAATAVNKERDEKNQIINGLLFKLADQKAENLFERAQCCCEKNQITIANVYDRLAAADQCNYDRLAADNLCNFNRLDAKIDCVSDKATMRTDATFALRKAQVDAQIAQEMCGVIKGKPYLSPCQMADPYLGGQQLLAARTVVPAVNYVTPYNDCGCSDWAW